MRETTYLQCNNALRTLTNRSGCIDVTVEHMCLYTDSQSVGLIQFTLDNRRCGHFNTLVTVLNDSLIPQHSVSIHGLSREAYLYELDSYCTDNMLFLPNSRSGRGLGHYTLVE